ncbi:MAG: hypothetical protein LBR25_06775 [Erysipelotrichaceae bacterium]|jgi:hypothetical protein|nr:hypothetical protein [Erysipelotrichaceae bacterium]
MTLRFKPSLQIPDTGLIIGTELYQNRHSTMRKPAFYKAIRRLIDEEKLIQIDRDAFLPVGCEANNKAELEKIILSYYMDKQSGMYAKDSLLFQLGLINRKPAIVQIYSNRLLSQTRRIAHIQVKYKDIVFTENVQAILTCLEILDQHPRFDSLDPQGLRLMLTRYAKKYSDLTLGTILKRIRVRSATLYLFGQLLQELNLPNSFADTLEAPYRRPDLDLKKLLNG